MTWISSYSGYVAGHSSRSLLVQLITSSIVKLLTDVKDLASRCTVNTCLNQDIFSSCLKHPLLEVSFDHNYSSRTILDSTIVKLCPNFVWCTKPSCSPRRWIENIQINRMRLLIMKYYFTAHNHVIHMLWSQWFPLRPQAFLWNDTVSIPLTASYRTIKAMSTHAFINFN